MDDNTPRGDAGRLESARDTIRAKAVDLASNAKEQASKQFDSKVGVATSELGSVASALRNAGEQLRNENGSSMGATVISLIADRLDTMSGSIGGRDLNTTLDDIQRIARRNPAAFMGTAAAVGFLAARFLKSSSPGWSGLHEEEFGSRSGFGSGYGTGYSAAAGSSATGWDAPSPAGSGLTGTAEGIQIPPAGTKGGSGSESV